MPLDAPLLIVDELDTAHIRGWALSQLGVARVLVCIDGRSVGVANYGLDRPDVAIAYPDVPGSSECGFVLRFLPEHRLRVGESLELVVEDSEGKTLARNVVSVERPAVPSWFRYCGFDPLAEAPTFAPFPHGAALALNAFDPMSYELATRWPDATVERAVSDIARLTRGVKQPSPLTHYVTFLEGLLGRFTYIHSEYPAIATTVPEMLCIAHHLYVLHSYGLRGALAEFGCFKGFSTSCLSHAVSELGLRLDTFDSFEGLPHAEGSSYNAGEFAGSLDEVRNNVNGFGVSRVVRMHKGYFAASLPAYDGSPMAIWMDVDLEASSRDVMTLLPQVAKLGCVFTHEAVAEFVSDGKVTVQRGPDSVLPPIVDAFSAAGRPYSAKHLVDCLSCLWDSAAALPPLPYNLLEQLINT